MSDLVKNMDPAFQGVGQRIGNDIWRIENLHPVPLPKSDYGKFYSGDSYIILQNTLGRGGGYQHDIHFWIGKDTSQDEAKSVSIKAVELDTVLGGHAIHHREIQGFESDKFLSYFKPCFIPLEGGHASGVQNVVEENFETRLYVSKGKRVVRLKQVPFARSSLNHDDIFILDTENKIYQFNGANSSIQERAKALDVIHYLMDKYHDGKCDASVIDDGKLAAESDSGDFWVIFGGFAPISKRIATEDDIILETSPGKLYSIIDGQLKKCKEGALSKTMLENNKCYLLDCGAEVFVWVGRLTNVEERKAAGQAAEIFVNKQNRPKSTHIIRVSQGHETRSFKSNFDTWPTSTVISGGDEGRGKVAALLKKKGDVKGTTKSTPLNEEIISLLEKGGKLEVWCIDGSSKTMVPDEEIGKFYSGDCYIVLYTYHSSDKKEDYFLSFWIGKDSTVDDQAMASKLTDTMHNSLKGRPVLARFFQGKEPPQFTVLFQTMVILKGGNSSDYKKTIAEKNIEDQTYASDRVALIEISNPSVDNNKAVQVDAVATSLNSNSCFLLQSGSSVFIWNGISSTPEQQQLAAKVAEFLKPGVHLKHAKEGAEISSFWFPLGGKQSYSSKKTVQDTTKYPHLFTFSMNKGKLQVSEVFNFSQDDLLTEDTLILDTHAEIFIWLGHSVDNKEKKCAFDIGQEYINLAVSLDGLSPHVPLYKITEGNEPCFFTSYFSWDNRKAAALFGDSFAKRMSLLFGTSEGHHGSESNDGGPTQRASALAALSSAFNPTSSSSRTASTKTVHAGQGSQRAAAVAALSNVLTQEQKKASEASSPPPGEAIKCEDPHEQVVVEEDTTCVSGNDDSSQVEPEPEPDTTTSNTGEIVFYSYEQLKAKSTDPIQGINNKEREKYLSDPEFEEVLGMPKPEFYALPKWKQDMQKKKVDLF